MGMQLILIFLLFPLKVIKKSVYVCVWGVHFIVVTEPCNQNHRVSYRVINAC